MKPTLKIRQGHKNQATNSFCLTNRPIKTFKFYLFDTQEGHLLFQKLTFQYFFLIAEHKYVKLKFHDQNPVAITVLVLFFLRGGGGCLLNITK